MSFDDRMKDLRKALRETTSGPACGTKENVNRRRKATQAAMREAYEVSEVDPYNAEGPEWDAHKSY